MQVGAFLTKVVVMIWLLMLIRWTLPRFRYDQAMRLGWLALFPLSVLNILVTGLVLLAVGEPRGLAYPAANTPPGPPDPIPLRLPQALLLVEWVVRLVLSA